MMEAVEAKVNVIEKEMQELDITLKELVGQQNDLTGKIVELTRQLMVNAAVQELPEIAALRQIAEKQDELAKKQQEATITILRKQGAMAALTELVAGEKNVDKSITTTVDAYVEPVPAVSKKD